jgi:hypothetical protein
MAGSMTRAVSTLIVLVALGASAASAHASVTVGVADLGQWTPNLSVGCSQEPYFGYSTGASACTYYTTSSRQLSTDGTNIVPTGYGVITKIRVKTANVSQGPMQVVAFRSIRQSNSPGFPGCCWPQYATPRFVPSPGGVTEINTNLPVMNSTLLEQYVGSGDISYDSGTDAPPWDGVREVPAGSQGIENFDQIGLTVLDGTTPIPAANTGDWAGPAGGAFWPGLTDRSLRTDVAGLNGVQVLLQGLWEADADRDGLGDETQDPDGGRRAGDGAVSTPEANVKTQQPPPTGLSISAAGRIVGRAAQIPLTCTTTTACTGVLRLLSGTQAAGGARAAARRPQVYGRARFSIPARRTRKVKVKLTRAATRKLARRKSLTAFAQVSRGAQVVTSRITLRRSR